MKFYKDQPGVWCLNRGWKFKETDCNDLPAGVRHDDIYDYTKAGGAKGPAELSFDDSDWEPVNLPHDWVTGKPFEEQASPNHGYKKRGTGWYRLKFRFQEEDRNKQILLEFEGLSSKAFIYINGTLCKRQFYGYNSFCVDITDMVCFAPAVNLLAVRIEADAWEGWWYEGAGIYRNVWMVKKSPVHIAYQGVYVKPEQQSDGTWKLDVETTVENSFGRDQRMRLEAALYLDRKKQQEFPAVCGYVPGFESAVYKQSITVDQAKIWSTGNPVLYEVRSVCRGTDGEKSEERKEGTRSEKASGSDSGSRDYLNTRFGFRTIRLDADTGFWLNGENIKLKGFCCHQDHAGTGVAVPYAVKEYRVSLLKKLGANAYRCAHNPDPEILDICDRLGMMVMEENRTFSSDEDTLAQVRGIIRNARNHPSVILYSIFNEEPLQGTLRGGRMAARMRKAVHEMDTTRPVLGSFNGGYLEEEGAALSLDAVGINYNPQRYDEFHSKYPDIPLVGSETASAFMVRGEYEDDEERHKIASYDESCAPWGAVHREAWRWVMDRQYVAGGFIWTGFDYRGEPTPFEWPSVGTFFGTYDSCGFPKEACYLYQAFWTEAPMVHLAAPWGERSTPGEPVKVLIITNCQEVEITVNGRMIQRKTADRFKPELICVPYEPGKLKAVGYRDKEPAARHTLEAPQAACALKVSTSRAEFCGDGLDAVVVNVCAVDQEGHVIPDADQTVFFEISGGGVLIGTGNGDPNSHEPDTAPCRKLFHGYAQAVIRNHGSDTVTVRVRSEGLKEAEVILPVRPVAHIPYVEEAKDTVVEGWRMYHQLLDQKPDALLNADVNDRNSFEPIEFHGRPQSEFTGKLDKYGVYQTQLSLTGNKGGRYLYFPEIKGQVWVSLNQEQVAERVQQTLGPLKAEIPAAFGKTGICTVVIRNQNTENGEAGICAPVILSEEDGPKPEG
ncbi:glycoside hydrolase family 2 TIM barrel-domain containing protein [Diplocloster hominis]|uniref:glycoside hydrolase family 2 TIM barrel-domain containing protein n=1 Tax=Diplocloster hominis TaxID=3079010 RepID=UPI0031BAEB60